MKRIKEFSSFNENVEFMNTVKDFCNKNLIHLQDDGFLFSYYYTILPYLNLFGAPEVSCNGCDNLRLSIHLKNHESYKWDSVSSDILHFLDILDLSYGREPLKFYHKKPLTTIPQGALDITDVISMSTFTTEDLLLLNKLEIKIIELDISKESLLYFISTSNFEINKDSKIISVFSFINLPEK